MSTPKPKIHSWPVCWLCNREIQGYLEKDEVEGRPAHYDCRRRRIWAFDSIWNFSGPAKVKPEAFAQETFKTGLYKLDLAQLKEMVKLIAAIEVKRSDHYHRCFACGCRVECYEKGCTEAEDECRPCHEGMSEREFERMVARLF